MQTGRSEPVHKEFPGVAAASLPRRLPDTHSRARQTLKTLSFGAGLCSRAVFKGSRSHIYSRLLCPVL